MYSSVVGQNRLALHTEVTDGFQVTSERDRYLNRLKPRSSFSKPGSARISGSSCATSWNWRLTGRASRNGESPSLPGMRLVAMRERSISALLSPCLEPEELPGSSRAADRS